MCHTWKHDKDRTHSQGRQRCKSRGRAGPDATGRVGVARGSASVALVSTAREKAALVSQAKGRKGVNNKRLYMAVFSDGWMKVGMASNIGARLRSLQSMHGGAICQSFDFGAILGAAQEAAAHRAVGAMATQKFGREWYLGVSASAGREAIVDALTEYAKRNAVSTPLVGSSAAGSDGSIVFGRCVLERDGRMVRVHDLSMPGVSVLVDGRQFERWALRQLRDSLFSAPETKAAAEAA